MGHGDNATRSRGDNATRRHGDTRRFPRSVRVSDEVWVALKVRAAEEGVSVGVLGERLLRGALNGGVVEARLEPKAVSAPPPKKVWRPPPPPREPYPPLGSEVEGSGWAEVDAELDVEPPGPVVKEVRYDYSDSQVRRGRRG